MGVPTENQSSLPYSQLSNGKLIIIINIVIIKYWSAKKFVRVFSNISWETQTNFGQLNIFK